MRRPGFEPGSSAWKADILAIILPALISIIILLFKKVFKRKSLGFTMEPNDEVNENPVEKQEISEPKVIEQEENKPEIKQEIKEKSKKVKEFKPRLKFMSSDWYDKKYKILLLISILITVFVAAQLIFMYATTGDIMRKDVSLTGGTLITIQTDKQINVEEFTLALQTKLGESVSIKKLSDITTGKQIAIAVESKADPDKLKEALQEQLGFQINENNSSTEIMSAGLSKSFDKELMQAVVLAFIFMAVVIFIIFRKPIPCIAVVQAGATDALGALVIANLFGLTISTAGIAAVLMLIGYSVDTDIMLTTKVLKRREGTVNQRIKGAFKTGITMTLTSFIAVFAAYFIVNSAVLKEIFFILAAGLFLDILTTWLGNAAILKWYCKKKNIN